MGGGIFLMPPYNRSRPIPGVTGKRIPGRTPNARTVRGSQFRSNVPFQAGGSDIFREAHRQQVRDVSGRFGGGWGFAWQGLEMVADNLQRWQAQNFEQLRLAAEQLKDEMVSYMKANAPWSDRTGAAREGLQGAVVWNNDSSFTIMLGHGADIYYGIWLEVRWGGRFAIVSPTVQHFAPMFGERLRTMT